MYVRIAVTIHDGQNGREDSFWRDLLICPSSEAQGGDFETAFIHGITVLERCTVQADFVFLAARGRLTLLYSKDDK